MLYLTVQPSTIRRITQPPIELGIDGISTAYGTSTWRVQPATYCWGQWATVAHALGTYDHRDYELVTSWGMILQQFMARTIRINNNKHDKQMTTIDTRW